MFQVGEFSRIASVTIETLRHYDKFDLFKPAKVDPFTGYRYYKADQLQTLHQIMALKEVGLSLEEIKKLLHDNPSTEIVRDILNAHTAAIQHLHTIAPQIKTHLIPDVGHDVLLVHTELVNQQILDFFCS